MTTQLRTHEATLAKPIAGEDLRRGEYVAILSEIIEVPSFLWCGDGTSLPTSEPVRMQCESTSDGTPLQIIDICLPFVFTKAPGGAKRIVDIRRCQLARLDRRYAKRVWKALRGTEGPRRRDQCQL